MNRENISTAQSKNRLSRVEKEKLSTNNASIFRNAYRQIEATLRDKYAEKHGANAAERADGVELINDYELFTTVQRDYAHQCRKIRNILAHELVGGIGADPLIPSDQVVAMMQKIRALVQNPPRVRDVLPLQKPRILRVDSSLTEFLKIVKNPGDLWLSPVRTSDGSLRIITTNMVTLWIATKTSITNAKRSGSETELTLDNLTLTRTTLGELLPLAESSDHAVIAGRDLLVAQAIKIFHGSDGNAGSSASAILITANGREDGDVLGVCLRTDVPQLAQALQIS